MPGYIGNFRYEEELNDDKSTANMFGTKIAGSLGSSSDVDWFSFSLPTRTTISVNFAETNYQPGIWNLSWYTPMMQGISELNISTSSRDGVSSYNYNFNTGDSSGIYYLRIKPYSPTTLKSDIYYITVDVPKVPTISLVHLEANISANGSSAAIPISIQLDAPSTGTIVVHYTTRSGTATTGDYFGSSSGNITITPGETIKTLSNIFTSPYPISSDKYFYVDFDNILIGSAQFNNGTSSLTEKINLLVPTPPISIVGGSGNDILFNLNGDNMVDGGIGTDTLQYGGVRANFSIVKSASGFVVTENVGIEGVDTLVNVERIKFFDLSVALDVFGVGGQAYRIYQAAFNRAPDLKGVGYWMSQMDKGASLKDVSAGFVGSSEFQSLYGSAPTNAQIIEKFYQNVLHRTGEPAGIAYWTGVLDSHSASVPDVLVGFSESPENQTALIGVIGNGFTYVPYN